MNSNPTATEIDERHRIAAEELDHAGRELLNEVVERTLQTLSNTKTKGPEPMIYHMHGPGTLTPLPKTIPEGCERLNGCDRWVPEDYEPRAWATSPRRWPAKLPTPEPVRGAFPRPYCLMSKKEKQALLRAFSPKKEIQVWRVIACQWKDYPHFDEVANRGKGTGFIYRIKPEPPKPVIQVLVDGKPVDISTIEIIVSGT